MPNDEIEHLLNEIGQILAKDTDYPLDGTLLYAELDQNFVAPSIFKDLGDRVLYREPDLDLLGDVLLDLWEAQDSENRWRDIQYVVRDGKFETVFIYPDEIDPQDERWDRRDRAVARHFGEKPIVYPPKPKELNTFKL